MSMTTLTEPTCMTLPDLLDSLRVVDSAGPAWLRDRREDAAARFRELGLPTLQDEEWRQTSLKSLYALKLAPIESVGDGGQVDSILNDTAIPGLDCPRAVFVNGAFAAAHSDLDAVPAGMTFLTLAEALEKHGDLLEQHLANAGKHSDAFASLNAALADEVAVVIVDRNADVTSPLYVLNVTAARDGAIITNPRMLVIAAEGSRATIIEDHVGTDGQAYFTNAVTEVSVGANANITHYFLERESVDATNISTLRIRQDRDSTFMSHTVLLGGAVVRNNVNPSLEGENILSTLNGLYLPTGTQHHDNHMLVEHHQPNCESRQYYKGLLNDKTQGVFSGRIVVDRIAQKTDAIQSNQNLLLSLDARAHTKPQLEIYADDVRCTHGATIGELDDPAIFYLRSRGMSEDAARSMLIFAFAGESLDRMNNEPIRKFLQQTLIDRLPDGRVLGMTD